MQFKLEKMKRDRRFKCSLNGKKSVYSLWRYQCLQKENYLSGSPMSFCIINYTFASMSSMVVAGRGCIFGVRAIGIRSCQTKGLSVIPVGHLSDYWGFGIMGRRKQWHGTRLAGSSQLLLSLKVIST